MQLATNDVSKGELQRHKNSCGPAKLNSDYSNNGGPMQLHAPLQELRCVDDESDLWCVVLCLM